MRGCTSRWGHEPASGIPVIQRADGRGPADLRPVKFELGFQEWAEGSVLFEMGRTRVLVAASVEDQAPRFLSGTGKGWVTAEYAMLPRATLERTSREVGRGRPSGRTQEIQRLIGRSLRAVTDLTALGDRTFVVDCDVLQADAGTRTASITAGYIALALATRSLVERGELSRDPLRDTVGAVSVGIIQGSPVLDLAYEEDASAQVDCNVVMTGSGTLVEVQGTAEGDPFDREQLDGMLDLATEGIARLTEVQRRALA
jgi:ribonuclease PH